MAVRVNNLFDVDVTAGDGEWTYTLYTRDTDDQVYEEKAGSAYTSSEDAMKSMGEYLMRQYAKSVSATPMYGIALVYRGSIDIKWWHEIEARDTTAMFHKQLKKPDLQRVEEFDFLIPQGAYIYDDIHRIHALMAYLDANKVTLLGVPSITEGG